MTKRGRRRRLYRQQFIVLEESCVAHHDTDLKLVLSKLNIKKLVTRKYSIQRKMLSPNGFPTASL